MFVLTPMMLQILLWPVELTVFSIEVKMVEVITVEKFGVIMIQIVVIMVRQI